MYQPPQWGPQPFPQPHGFPPPPVKKGMGACGFFAILFAVALVAVGGLVAYGLHKASGMPSKPRVAKTALELKRGDEPHMGFDGCIYAVKEYVKPGLKDPDSFECSCGDVVGEGDFWAVACTYRAKNSFGAKVPDGGKYFIQGGKVQKVEKL